MTVQNIGKGPWKRKEPFGEPSAKSKQAEGLILREIRVHGRETRISSSNFYLYFQKPLEKYHIHNKDTTEKLQKNFWIFQINLKQFSDFKVVDLTNTIAGP